MPELIIPEIRAKVAEYLATHDLPAGLGDESSACSIAAINLAISGIVTDELHPCMCPIIRAWTIRIQDRMPAGIRNSGRWKSLVPLIAGSWNPESEKARLDLICSEMWRAIAIVQPIADRLGFGAEWKKMIEEKDKGSCIAARNAAASNAASNAAASNAASYAVANAPNAPNAYAAYAAAYAVAYAADAADADAWEKINPCETLEKLLKL